MTIKRIRSHNAPLALLCTHGLTTTSLLDFIMYPLHHGVQVFIFSNMRVLFMRV